MTEADESIVELLEVPDAPVFGTLEEERSHRKRMLAATFRIFSRLGYDEGVAGHVTARDPEISDHFWVNPYGVHFSRIHVSDLLRIDSHGRIVEGTRRTNKAAFHIHSSIHSSRLDVIAAAHAHTIHGRAWATLDRLLDPIIQESCAFYEDHALYRDYGGLVLNEREGDQIAAVLGDRRAIILRHHGLITVGNSVEEAAWWFITMDRCAQIQMLAEAAGTPRVMPPAEAAIAHRQFGNPNMARYSFQLLYEALAETDPSFLE